MNAKRSPRPWQLCSWILLSITGMATVARSQETQNSSDNFARDHLVAWCIVPFDAEKRTPEARVEMLKRVGIKRVAYDWRAEHVSTFEEEITRYADAGIEFFAFWDEHPAAFELFRKHSIHPQVWKMMPNPDAETQEEKVRLAAEALRPLVKRTAELGCKLGIYNHGGWAGEPENMVAVAKWLREHDDASHVGVVYNFHHGHEHLSRIDEAIQLMKPYLHCVNLNGMNSKPDPKILPIGKGEHDSAMIRTLKSAGYEGPIGILDHRPELDTELSLRQNMEGLTKLLKTLEADSP